MKTRIDGIDIDYDRYGKGDQTILFLHGWHQNFGRQKYKKLLKCLSKRYQVIALDFPGFGDSDIYSNPWTVFDFANFIGKFVDKLNIKPCVLVGHSFGGCISIVLSSHPKLSDRFSHLVLINSAGIRTKPPKIKAIIFLSKFIPETIKTKLSGLFPSNEYSSLNGVKKKTFSLVVSQDLQEYMPRISIPTLILWGGEDNTTPMAHAKIINRKIKKSQLIISPEDNHGLPYRNHRFTCSRIHQFLNQ